MNILKLAFRIIFRRRQLKRANENPFRSQQEFTFLPSQKEVSKYITVDRIQIGKPIRTKGNKLN